MRRIYVIGVLVLVVFTVFAGCGESDTSGSDTDVIYSDDEDTDGDGVVDSEDACPEYAANTDDGCPEDEPTGGL